MPVALKCNFNVKLNVFGYIFRLPRGDLAIEYSGGGGGWEFLTNKQQGSCYWWMSFCGLAPAAGGCGAGRAAAGAGGTHVSCLREGGRRRSSVCHGGSLEHAVCFCAAWSSASTVPVLSGLEDAFFLSWCTDLKDVVTHCLSHTNTCHTC